MKKIPLTQGKFALVDDEDFDALNQFKWCALRGNTKRPVYYAGRGTYIDRRPSFRSMHRDIMGLTDGKIHVDHIDGDGLNNQRVNLRLSSHALNARNMRSHVGSTSNYIGVGRCKRTKLWQAQIKINYRNIHLGRFKTEHEAAMARDAAARELYGEFAYLNFQT